MWKTDTADLQGDRWAIPVTSVALVLGLFGVLRQQGPRRWAGTDLCLSFFLRDRKVALAAVPWYS